MTRPQIEYLKSVKRMAEPEGGYAEVDMDFLAGSSLPPHLGPSTCVRIAKTLERKGMLVRDAGGPVLTPMGEKFLAMAGEEP